MSTRAAIWAAIIAALVLAALTGAGLIVTSGLRDSINAKSAQVAQLQHAVKGLQAQVRDNPRLAQLQAEVAGLKGKLHPGAGNDVITCGDLQNMGLTWDSGVTVDNQGNVSLDTQPVTLPQHCVKS